jgi:hypothetical protein
MMVSQQDFRAMAALPAAVNVITTVARGAPRHDRHGSLFGQR